jgi:hypothetical protein
MRVLGFFCLFAVLLPLAAAASPEPCAFSQAVYESLDDPTSKLSSEKDGRIVVRKANGRDYGFRFFGKPGAEILERAYETQSPYFYPVNFSFFDERLIAAKNPAPSSPAPAYIYLSGPAEVEGPMFQLKACKQGSSIVPVSIPKISSAISVPACPFYRAVYTNIEDPSLTVRSEKDRDFFANLRVVIKGGKTPERPYTFGFTNGSGILFIQTNDGGNEESSDYMFLDESLRFDGIGSADDPAPPYFFMTSMKNVPASMFRLEECKPETPASKPTP